MRDTFLLLWVAFIIIGVIGSIVSSIRKQAAKTQPVRQVPQRVILSPATSPSEVARVEGKGWQPPPGQLPEWVQRLASQTAPAAPRVAPKPVPAIAPKAPTAPPPMPEFPSHRDFSSPGAESGARVGRLFRRKAIVEAIIAAEVLGKPRALRDEYS